jgi:hypothetical protein
MVTDSDQNALPSGKAQWEAAVRLLMRILLPLAAVFILFCLVLDKFVRVQLIGENSTHGAGKLFRIQATRPLEIPILGSSRALCAFIPDTLGKNYYNYGINGIGYAVMDIFMKRELAQHGKHGPIILNFDFTMFYYQLGDRSSYLPHASMPEVKALLKRHDEYSPYMIIPGIRYFGGIDAIGKEYLNQRIELTKSTNKGAVIERIVTHPSHFEALVKRRIDTMEPWRPRKELIDSLFKRIGDHPEREFIIVVSPYHASYLHSIPSADLARVKQLFQQLDALPNARVIDFDTHDWPDECFSNTSHVSMIGARRVSQMLRDSLKVSPVPL